MPERNNEVVIDGYVFPDTVTVTLVNDEYINSRDYVSKELYESVCGANDVWQAENAKLREYAKLMHGHIKECCDACGECGFCDIDALTRELGIEVDA